MGIIVDVVIVALIALSTFLAYRKGLVKLAMQLFAFVIAIVVTLVVYRPISNFVINSTGIDESIENFIYEKANEIMQEDEEGTYTSQITEAAKNEMLPEAAKTLSVNIVKMATLIILYIAVQIILRLITGLADAIANIPVLKQINKAGGIVYGLLRGILIVYVVLMLVGLFNQIQVDNQATQSINQSYIGKMMYENNVLDLFFATVHSK